MYCLHIKYLLIFCIENNEFRNKVWKILNFDLMKAIYDYNIIIVLLNNNYILLIIV
jgi:hypothetical protein